MVDTVTLPRSDLYVDGETVVAEWHADSQQLQAHFAIVDVSDDDAVDYDDEAIFTDLAHLNETREFVDDATIDDVPRGLLWALKHFAAPPAANPEYHDEDEDGGGRGRGVA